MTDDRIEAIRARLAAAKVRLQEHADLAYLLERVAELEQMLSGAVMIRTDR